MSTELQYDSLKIGFLGVSDNASTRIILEHFHKEELELQVVVLEHLSMTDNRKRFIRNLRARGVVVTLRKSMMAIWNRFKARYPSNQENSNLPYANTVLVKNVNSVECERIIRGYDLDILLLSTDTMIKRRIFSAPRFGALNAHPGWSPAYRGLGSKIAMLRDAKLPAITVHFVNEGVDTGPIVRRDFIKRDVIGADQTHEANMFIEQAECFLKALDDISRPGFKCIDTFCERSNMTRGFSSKEASIILRKAQGLRNELQPL